jgi:CBS domain-containing protein
MTLEQGFSRIKEIAEKMKEDRESGLAPSSATPSVREFMSWFGYARRGIWVVERVREELEANGLHTEPDFQHAYVDGPISFRDSSVSTPPADSTLRVDILKAAHNSPTTVTPTHDLKTAVTHMMSNDFSQIPVMEGQREVKGVITWESVGSKTAMGQSSGDVLVYMERSEIIDGKQPLFDAVSVIARTGYVLVRGLDNTITGIVTASDLNDQFLQLAEPFLLVGEIERHIRRVIHGQFTREELVGLSNTSDNQAIDHIADLTFGDYCRLLEDPPRWEKLNLKVERTVFVKLLHEIRDIRNNVMHFNPDGLDPEDVRKLRYASRFFQRLAH